MLHHFKTFPAILLLAAVLMLAACSSPSPQVDSGAIFTQAVKTAGAHLTESASSQPSATSAPSQSLTETPEPAQAQPTAAPSDTALPAPLETQTPEPTATGALLNSATFIADVNYPDNSTIAPGDSFEKQWRIQNNGTTTWTSSYSLVCIDSGKLTCPESTSISRTVKSGETIDVAVKLTAPSQPGTYKAYFRLRNASGQFFKLDKTGDLWVQIVVGQPATVTPTAGEATATLTAAPSEEPTQEFTLTPSP